MPYYITYKDKKLDGEFNTHEEAADSIKIISTDGVDEYDDFAGFLIRYKTGNQKLAGIITRFIKEIQGLRNKNQ